MIDYRNVIRRNDGYRENIIDGSDKTEPAKGPDVIKPRLFEV